MNTQVDTAAPYAAPDEGRDTHLPAGAGLALAVLLGSVLWLGIFALLM